MRRSANSAPLDRRIRRTRNAIREALQTLLQSGGIEQVTIRDIADAADIGYTTFFRHFPSKEAALADLADSAARELIVNSFPLLRTADSRAATLALCRHVDLHRSTWIALLTGGAAAIVRDAMLSRTLERSKDWPRPRSWLPPEAGTSLVIGLVVETLTWWLSHAPELAPEAVAEIMNRMFIAALTDKE